MKKTKFLIGASLTMMLVTLSFSINVIAPEEDIYVYVDIKPGSCPNSIMMKSHGVFTVAICGEEDFDVTHIDPATVTLVGVAPLRWSYEDVATPFDGEPCGCHEEGPDGYLDLKFKFRIGELPILIGSDKTVVTLDLIGQLKAEFGGTVIEGSDCAVFSI